MLLLLLLLHAAAAVAAAAVAAAAVAVIICFILYSSLFTPGEFLEHFKMAFRQLSEVSTYS